MADVDVSYGKLVIIDTYDGPAASVEIAKIAESALAYVDNPNPGVELYTHLTGISAETFYFSNDVFIKHDLTISGNLFFDSLDVSGDSNFKSDINVYNDCSINKNLFVNNLTTLNGRTNINGILNTQDDCTFEGSSNDIRIQGNFNIGTSFGNPTFKVLSHTGRTTIIGDLSLSEVLAAGKLGSSNNARIAHMDYSKDNYAFQQDNSGVTSINAINGKYITFDISQNEKIRIDSSGNTHFNSSDPSYVAIDISATSGIKLPKGTTSERPEGNPDISGIIRYNTETQQFEGYATAWQGLGGVIDVDQDTKITAEDDPNDDNDELRFYTKGIERMKVDASGTIQMMIYDDSYIALDISATTGIMLPKGNTAQRPVAGGRDTSIREDISGVIRYNTETQQFEGYATAWQGLGGVIDVDQNTKITAEDKPNDDNNELKFFTAGHQRMIIDASNNIDISTNLRLSGDTNVLDVSGATTIHNTLNVLGATAIDNALLVTGNMTIGDTVSSNGVAELHAPSTFYIDPSIVGDNTGLVVIKGNLQVDGTTTTINSTTVDISDLTIKLAANSNNAASSNGAGIEVEYGGSILYKDPDNVWEFNRGVSITSGTLEVTNSIDCGSSGTFADTLICSKDGTGLSVSKNATIGGTLTLPGGDVQTQINGKQDTLTAGTNVTISGTTISSTDTIYSLPLAASGTRGGVKIGYSENGKNYPVELSSEKMFVNVPWTDTVYSLPLAANGTRGGVQIGYSQNNRNYPLQLNANDRAYVNVPWTDTTYTAGTGLSLSGTQFLINDDLQIDSLGVGRTASGTSGEIRARTLDVDGNTNVNGHISFNKNVTNYSTSRGIWWHTIDSNDHGIYREAGTWITPADVAAEPWSTTRRLIIKWSQGILIDGGSDDGYGNGGIELAGPIQCEEPITVTNSTTHINGIINTGKLFIFSAYNGDALTSSTSPGTYYIGTMHSQLSVHGYNSRGIGFYTSNAPGGRNVPGVQIKANGSINCSQVQSIGSSTQASDDRIKFNEEPLTQCLGIINKLKPMKYDKIIVPLSENYGEWIPTDASWNDVSNNYTYIKEIGLIAQDVRDISGLDILVDGSLNDLSGNQTVLSFNYNGIFVIGLKAIQELHELVLEQASIINNLQSRIVTLENR
tara:strand:- start:1981 stop:5397 length:3417 start_codon:yes stop_codon:yes gene_type:complete